jgi:hypothetical protein
VAAYSQVELRRDSCLQALPQNMIAMRSDS